MNDYNVIKSRLQDTFREVFDDSTIEIYEAMTAHDLEGWDSLSHITLVVHVEKQFGVKLSAAEVGSLANVGKMIELLVQRATK